MKKHLFTKFSRYDIISELETPYMQISYTRELELLILETLLPIYEKWHVSQGNANYMQGINPDLLKQVKQVKKVPKLLLPK